jgi:hypothetical protein
LKTPSAAETVVVVFFCTHRACRKRSPALGGAKYSAVHP